ncbi:MAG: hypothetical protein AAF806_17720 [Bacteroidota bacterium]
MKKYFSSFFAFVFTLGLYAQVRVLPDKVGIGTENPESKLNILNGTDANAVSGGYIINGPLNATNLAIDNNEIQGRNNGVVSGISLNFEGGSLTFGGPSNDKRMYLSTAGRVGIGTAAPDKQLHLLGDGFIRLEQTGLSNGEWGEVNSTGVGTLRLYQHDNNGFGGIDILPSGNVGIGTNNPQSRLQLLSGTDANAVSGGYIINGSLNATNLAIDNNEIQARNNGNASGISVNFEGGSVLLGGPTPDKRFYLTTAGNVGIGTSNIPSGYKVAIDGNTICEELMVELSGNWPDYVFREDYELLPLSELKVFVEDKGHLPNIPSADTIEGKGVQAVGAIQIKLLEKIEELTLYILQQEERIKQLEAIVNDKNQE